MKETNYEQELYEDLEITNDLEGEFSGMSSRFSRWSFLLVRANEEVRRLEDKLEALFYALYAQAKSELGDGSKENECKACIHADRTYRKTKEDLNSAKADRDTLKVMVDALYMRKEMLQQLGPLFRREYDMVLAGSPREAATQTVNNELAKVNRRLHNAAQGRSPQQGEGSTVEDMMRDAQKDYPQDLLSRVDCANAITNNPKGRNRK